MTLYLHIGTNKTGSSFLQTSLILNAVVLREAGLHLPSSQWDDDMRDGKITPGNGHSLAKFLAVESEIKVIQYLKQIISEARQYQCDKIILSNEVIIRLFSNPGLLKLLESAAEKVGIETIYCLCFLRNPYDHALSLYKHRAKSGMYLEYSSWLEQDYETMRLFNIFLSHFRGFSINWLFHLYRSDSDYLLNILYKQVLQIKSKIQCPGKKVNASLSLNDIRLIGLMESLQGGIHEKLYRSLIEKRTKTKENPYLEARFMEATGNYLKKYDKQVQELGKLLPELDRAQFLQVPSIQNEQFDAEVEIMLTKEHMEIIRKSREWYYRFYLSIMGRRWYQKGLRSLNRMFLADQKKFDQARYGGSLR